MMKSSLYFVCEESCRLTDLNLPLMKGQSFERDKEVIETSRAVGAAIKAGWIREIKLSEYNKLNGIKTRTKKSVKVNANDTDDIKE